MKRRNGSRKLTAVLAAAVATVAMGAIASPAAATISIESFDATYRDANGDPATQAGGHPDTNSTKFLLDYVLSPGGPIFEPPGVPYPTEALKNTITELPPGFVGNPVALPQCSPAQFLAPRTPSILEGCPTDSQVGYVAITIGGAFTPVGGLTGFFPLYNLEPPTGTPALFGFMVAGIHTYLSFKLRTGDDYGLTAETVNAPATVSILGANVVFWGVPADSFHDEERGDDGIESCLEAFSDKTKCDHPSSADLLPFLSLPTSCVGPGPENSAETTFAADSWDDPGSFDTDVSFSHDNEEPSNPISFAGCNAVAFSPSIEARPTTNVADAPSGLDIDIEIPQTETCVPGPPATCENASAHLRDVTVTLPEGLVINPSGANGLVGCSMSEFGYTSTGEDGTIHTTADAASCPDASKQARVTVETPLLDHPLKGSLFVAEPFANPFGSLLALYLSVDDPQTGLVIKQAGEVSTNPTTGQLTATFNQNPQQPFEHLRVNFFGGANGALRTPATCGSYTATSVMTPWTAPEGEDKSPEDTWQITQGPNGGACAGSQAQLPHAPSFDAGVVSPVAGAYSPLVVNLRREDGTQNFTQVTVTPPPGMIGKLAGIPACPDSALEAAATKTGQEEQVNPSCPAASQVGTVHVAAGAGPAPYWVKGTAYLTGPYNGGPLGLAVITPAKAGPFDLGTVVTRIAVQINPVNAQITGIADPIPSILQGIPLDIRQALIRLDRNQFSLTGTSCDPLSFTGSVLSTLGQSALLSSRFQLGECSNLGFKPRMTLALQGGTKRRGHPSLTATLEPRPGDANLESISVALPPTELLDQSHIGTVCTRVQFAADQCPAASIYGTATVTTPLTDYPLTANVYLRSSANPLPDLVPDFRGPASQPIKLEAAGKTDTVKGALRNTFTGIPDAPFTKLVVTLPGGSKGLIQNSRNICAKKYRAMIKFIAQNGLALEQRPVVKTGCPKGKKSSRQAQRRGHRRAVR